MTDAMLIDHVQTALIMVLLLAGPALAVAAAIGLLVGLGQAVTQIQDQSLSQAIKVVAVFLSLLLLGPLIAAPFIAHTQQVFDAIAITGR